MKYFLWRDGRQDGPFDEPKIKQLLDEGAITADTLAIPEDSSGGWEEVSSLFPEMFQPEEPKTPPSPSRPPEDEDEQRILEELPELPEEERERESEQSSHIPPLGKNLGTLPSDGSVERRSGWATLQYVVGGLCIISGLACGVAAALPPDEVLAILAGALVIIGIQACFVGFLINVLTDIRWFNQESLKVQKGASRRQVEEILRRKEKEEAEDRDGN